MDTIPPMPHEVATTRSTPDFDWRNYVIKRIKVFKDRRVESLTPGELEAVTPWMLKVKDAWPTVDDGIKWHYLALRFARDAAGIPRVSSSAPEMSQQTYLAESADAPEQNFVIPVAPILSRPESSRTREIELVPPPAPPMSKPTGVEQSEFASNDVRFAEQQPLEHDSSKREEEISDAPVETQSLEVIRGLDSDQVLERLDEANAALEAANSLEAVKEIADIAAAAHLYARRAKRGKEAENKAAAYFCRASAKLGRMIEEGRKATRIQKRGRPDKKVQNVPISDSVPDKLLTLSDLGLDKREAAQARKLAKYTPNEFEARLKKKLDKLELSRTSTLEDPKPKEFKPATSEDCIKALFKLIEVLANSDAESFDTSFLESQKLDLGKYQAVRGKLSRLVVTVDAFVKSQPRFSGDRIGMAAVALVAERPKA
jgi:hypothetical protein